MVVFPYIDMHSFNSSQKHFEMKDDFNIFILCYYNVFVHAVIIYKLSQVVTNGFGEEQRLAVGSTLLPTLIIIQRNQKIEELIKLLFCST